MILKGRKALPIACLLAATSAVAAQDGATDAVAASPIDAMRRIMDHVVVEVLEEMVDEDRILATTVARFSRYHECETLEWWPITVPDWASAVPARPDLAVRPLEALAGPALRALRFDGLRQIDWVRADSRKTGGTRTWVAAVRVRPTLSHDRPRFLRLFGLSRVGDWYWDALDDRSVAVRQLRPQVWCIGTSVGADGHGRLIYVYDVMHFDGQHPLPFKVVESLPMLKPPAEVTEEALLAGDRSEFVVETWSATGWPELARLRHRLGSGLMAYRWHFHRLDVSAGLDPDRMCDARVAPDHAADVPVVWTDLLEKGLAELQPTAVEAPPTLPADSPPSDRMVTVGWLVVIAGAAWELASRLAHARPRGHSRS